MSNIRIENPNYRPITLVETAGSAAGVTLQNAYDAGAPATFQTITESAANGGVKIDAAGNIAGGSARNIFSVINSAVVDPTGNPVGFNVTAAGELLGQFQTAVRQRFPLYGGTTLSACDCTFEIANAQNSGLPAGTLILSAQNAVVGTAQSGGPVILTAGVGGGLLGGVDGTIVLSAPGGENAPPSDSTAPYYIIDHGPNAANPTSGGGMTWRSVPGSSSVNAFSLSSKTRFTGTSTAPMVAFFEGVLPAAGAELVEIWGDPNKTLTVFGGYGSLTIDDDARDVGHIGTGLTINAATGGAGGHSWSILSRGSGSVTGALTFFDNTVGGAPGEILELIGTGGGIVQPGNDGNTSLGASGRRWTDFFMIGKVLKYNAVTTAGVGVAYFEGSVQDAASAGTGVQATTILQIGPATGVYRVSVVVSVTVADAGVSVQLQYNDAVIAAAVAPTVAFGAVGGNSTVSTVFICRTSNAAVLKLLITLSSQATTKVSATMERLS